MNKLDKDYQALLQDILDNGHQKGDRTGTGTISVFGRQIRHKMSEGFPLLTTKKMYFKGIVTELLWFIMGNTNIKYLLDNDCHIWDGDAYKKYLFNSEWFPIASVNGGFIGTKADSDEIMTQELFINKIKTDDEFAKKWGELGPVYGKQWRNWGKTSLRRSKDGIPMGYDVEYIDQIANLINNLKTNPDSRRLMVNAWNVGELDNMTLPPCHYGFQVYTRELRTPERMDWLNKMNNSDQRYRNVTMDELNVPTRAISLMWNQRSVDTFLGLPFNIASYGLLLEIIAKAVNMVPDELVGNLGDVHLYSNHIEQAKEQIGSELSDEERYNIWFNNNYETGMERYFDPNKLPDFDNEYYVPTPKRTREPYELPNLVFGKTDEFFKELGNDLSLITHLDNSDFKIENYKSHPIIKAPLSN